VDNVNDSLAYYIALKRCFRGDAFVCAGRARVRTEADETSSDGMAAVRRDLARVDWDDFGIGSLGLRSTTEPVWDRAVVDISTQTRA